MPVCGLGGPQSPLEDKIVQFTHPCNHPAPNSPPSTRPARQGAQVTGEHMKRSATAIILASVIALTTVNAHAQDMGGFGGGHKKHQQKTDKTDPQKPKADEQAYKAAIKSLPDKPPKDPWQGAR